MTRARTILACLSFTLTLGGCASSGQLVAADGSRRMIARNNEQGLTMVVTTGAWTGSSTVDETYSVIHVLIDNQGSTPVLIAPGDFQLRDRFGFLYSLYDAGGTFRKVIPNEPYVDHRTYDPGQDTPFSSGYSSDPEFARAALPWGILDPGTQIRGFLYFDRLSANANRGTLLWQAQTPNHQPLSTLGFALFVARGVDQRTTVPPSPPLAPGPRAAS